MIQKGREDEKSTKLSALTQRRTEPGKIFASLKITGSTSVWIEG
jgi:hypothetical protein